MDEQQQQPPSGEPRETPAPAPPVAPRPEPPRAPVPPNGHPVGAAPAPPPPRMKPPRPPAPPQGAPQGQPPWTWQQGPPMGPPGAYGPPPQAPYGPPGYGPPQGGPYQRPPKRRSRALPLILGLVVLFAVLGFGLISLVAGVGAMGSSSSTGGSPFGMFGNKIAILDIEGVLGEGPGYGADTKKLVEIVNGWTDNKAVKAIVLRINSPGGAVSATQDLVQALNDFRSTSRPVYAAMGDIAASGGYYAATAADHVYANEGTLTGSIGVIMSFYNYEGLQEKLGVFPAVVKSGQFKDIGSGSRPMTEAEKALLDSLIYDVYEQFLDEVVAARTDKVEELHGPGLTPEQVRAHVKTYCDGRIFSGRQALEYGFIDELGTLQDALDAAAKDVGLADYTTVRAPVRPTGLFGAIGAVANRAQAVATEAGSVKLEYRFSP